MVKTSIEIGRGLADDDNEEDAAAWVSRMKKEKKKKKKQKEAQDKYDDLDEQAIETEAMASGMRVAHDVSAIDAEQEHVLVLKDQRILDDSGKCASDGEDILESAELVANEKREFNRQRSKALDRYDEEQSDTILAQYDEAKQEFEKSRKSFTLNNDGELDAQQLSKDEQKHLDTLAADKGMTRYDLGDGQKDFTWTTLQRDTYTEQEMAQFKKPKKKRVIKKRNREAAVEKMKELQREVTEQAEPEALRTHRVDDEDEQETALAKLAVRQKAMESVSKVRETAEKNLDTIVESSLSELKEGIEQVEEDNEKVYIDATSEFIKQLEAKVDVKEEVSAMEVEEEEDPEEKARKEESRKEYEKKLKSTKLVDGGGLGTTAAAMSFIQQKGLIHTPHIGRENDAVFETGDDGGPIVRRKDQYGRDITPHEAFRQQSRVFHGKMPSKNRVLKSERRWQELDKMRRVSEKDSLEGLRTAQATSGKAGVVLQGGMQDQLNKIQAGISSSTKRELEGASAQAPKRQK